MPDIDADLARGLRLLEQAPLGKLVEGIGTAIAEAQYNMDRFVIKTLELLDNNDENGVQLPDEVGKRSMLELGFTPSFYHFREATITAKVAFSAMKGEEFGVGAGSGVATPVSFLYR